MAQSGEPGELGERGLLLDGDWMLQTILDQVGIDSARCAALLGVSPDLFSAWAAGQRPIPESVVPMIASVLGVGPEELALSRRSARDRTGDVLPAIWFKLRSERLAQSEAQYVLLIRHLGYLVSELAAAVGEPIGWDLLFEAILRKCDKQAPPREQGRQAARYFRASRDLDRMGTGIAEALRGSLRSLGILVIETPIPGSSLEGCCFFVGPIEQQRPCVFANNHGTTWFRRNEILAHEVGHAIFDAASAGALLDFAERAGTDLAEERAQAFAQELLVPNEVLRHLSQSRGINWTALDVESLAWLVAATGVEQRTVLSAGLAAGLLTHDQAARAGELRIADQLHEMSEHALTAAEFIRLHADEDTTRWVGKRDATVPDLAFRLPAPYIKSVVEAVETNRISLGKAAELLMTDEDTVSERFGIPVLSDD